MARFDTSRGNGQRRGSSNKNHDRNKPRDRPSKNFSGNRSRIRERRDVQMTTVTCDSCGAECQVPFKPSSDKPVYCDACYGKSKVKSNDNTSKELELINKKLDRIIEALELD